MQTYEKIYDGLWLAVVGLCGAFVNLVVKAEVRTFRQKLSFLICGALTSAFLAKPIVDYFGLDNDKYIMALAFGIGLFGAAIIQAILRAINNLDLLEVLKKRFGL